MSVSEKASATIVDSMGRIDDLIKQIKLFPKKSNRLYQRISVFRENMTKSASSKSSSDILLNDLSACLKEIEVFLFKFTDKEYLLRSYSANIDNERFVDLTNVIKGFYSTFSISFDEKQWDLEDAKDKNEDYQFHCNLADSVASSSATSASNDGLSSTTTAAVSKETIQSGLENQDHKNIEPLQDEIGKSSSNLNDLRSKLRLIETDLSSYEQQQQSGNDLENTYLNIEDHVDCDKSHANKIGEGKFGIVYKGTFQRNGEGKSEEGKEEVSVKYLRDSSFSIEKQFSLRREVAKLSLLSHPSLILLYGANVKTIPYFFVYEYCYCSLYSALYAREENEKLNLFKGNYKKKLELLLECSSGMEYLHSLSLLHRNIKSTNILLSSSGHVKLTDFSFVMNKHDLSSSLLGTSGNVRASITGTGATLSAQKVTNSTPHYFLFLLFFLLYLLSTLYSLFSALPLSSFILFFSLGLSSLFGT
jgi:hypothetical protein